MLLTRRRLTVAGLEICRPRSAAITEALDVTIIAGLSTIAMAGFCYISLHSAPSVLDGPVSSSHRHSHLSAAESPRSPRFPLGPFLHSPTAPADEATIQLRRELEQYRLDVPCSPSSPSKSDRPSSISIVTVLGGFQSDCPRSPRS